MRVKETIKVWIKRCCIGGVAFFFATAVFASVLLFTPIGTSIVRWAGDTYIDGLSIGSSKGALLLSPQFEQVRFNGLGVDVKAQSIDIAFQPTALFKRKLIVESLKLHHANIIYQDNASASKENASTTEAQAHGRIDLPLDIYVQQIILDNIHIQALGHRISWQHFTSALALTKEGLTISPTNWQQLSVHLAPAKAEEPSKQKGVKSKGIIVLPKVVLPLDVRVQDFTLSQFLLYTSGSKKAPLAINQLALGLQGVNSDISIEYFNIDMPQIAFKSQGKITLNKQYPLHLKLNADIKEPQLQGHKISLNANGDLQRLHSEIGLHGAQQARLVSTLNLLDPHLLFEARLQGKQLGFPIQTLAEYRIQDMDLDAQGSLQGFKIKLQTETLGEKAPHTRVAFDGTGAIKDSGDWLIALNQLDIIGDYKHLPLDIKGRLKASSTDKQIRLQTPGVHIAHGLNKITLSGHIDKAYNLNLHVDVPHLEKSFSQARGRVRGDIGVTGQLAAPKIGVDLDVDRLAYKDESTLEKLSINGQLYTEAQGKAIRPILGGALRIHANKAHLLSAGIDIDNLDVILKGNEAKHQLDLNMHGSPIGIKLRMSGALDSEQSWRGVLASGSIMTSEGDWRLAKRTDISYLSKPHTLNIDSHCWQAQQSQICLAEALAFMPQTAGQARLSINQFSLPLLGAFLPSTTQLDGSLNADINAQWSEKYEPNLEAKVLVTRGNLVQDFKRSLKIEWDKIVFNARLKDRILDSNMRIDLHNNGAIESKLSIADIKATHRKVQGEVRITPLDISFLAPVIGEDIVLKGVVDSQIAIAGTLKKPELLGRLQLNAYQLRGDSAPMHINSGRLHVGLDKHQARLDGRLKTQEGELLVKGDADWQDLKRWSTHLNIKGEKLKVTPKSGVSIELSHDLTLSASPTDAEIVGKIVIPWARIKIQEVPKGAISITEDQQILDSNLQVVKQEKAPPLNIKTDISLDIDKNVKLQAYGLNSFLQGNLHITQVDKRPNINGDINLIHGTYQAFGQDLEITKGAILFSGPASQPYIDVTAIRNPETVEDNVTAGIKVTGPTTALDVSIFSDPSMEQADALSYILSGRAMGSTGGSSGMTSALIGLGLAQSGEFIGGIGNALGVQDLSLDTEGDGDNTALAVSGYITPDLQLKYGVGLFSPMGEFTVKYRLMKKLYVQAVAGMDNAADILYQFSFD